ncbi:ABC transporter ATP-binding protein [Opitutus terrae]|uniref:ABC transporter related n=1 Tax=Opitutus terrae (strain DSM 11246 / JCM 15787 / PB90-1) TaxID=452637 RepID=B1ZWX9_OPITP|nr:ABC transporter ATP-binding protein [Opitutus terrae]ACB75090.1 ABC transporter related [Opitutus terrae PB90-1]
MIEISGLSKRFRSRAVLQRLDLTVRPGAVNLLVGANGAGKTTLLRIIAQLAAPDAGTVRINGLDLGTEPLRALAQLSFLPQAPRFHPRLTTRQVAQYYGRLRRREPSAVDAELARWQLTDHLQVMTHQLSGGMRQRLALAVFALAHAPVLVLDEPGLSLDPFWREQLQQFLTDAAREGRTVLVATHLLGEWEGRVDACHHMQAGRIVGELPPARLRAAFAEAEGLPLPDREGIE